MKYFLIAGEASGDLHSSNLMRHLIRHDPGAEFRFMGGDLMEGVYPGLVMHYRDTNYMMADVFLHLGKIFRNIRRIKGELESWRPDVVITVDYWGFNFRIIKFAVSIGLRVYYFITPKVWAWKQKRVTKLRKYTSRLFVILPFEVEFFRKFRMETEYFGNPLVDGVSQFMEGFRGTDTWKASWGLDHRPVVALLAGSRRKEIQGMLPAMVRVAAHHPQYQFVVAGAPSIEPDFYSSFLEGTEVAIVHGETYGLLASAFAGMVTSGTATLEAALFKVPQVVMYRTSSFAYAIAKQLVKINFISLVNLILNREVVKEVIQKNMVKASGSALARILENREYRDGILDGYRELEGLLGDPGVADRIARRMVEIINEEDHA
ncbi:MAG: lipid-A-disaccharide synthase [Bacteroidota bacterium]